MRNLIFNLFIVFGAMLFTAVTLPAFAGGAGGSWGDDSGFTGNGGSFGGGGAGSDTSKCYIVGGYAGAAWGKTAACAKYSSLYGQVGSSVVGNLCTDGQGNDSDKYMRVLPDSSCGAPPPPPPECPTDFHLEGSSAADWSCVKDLKCPAGYVKDGNKCIWQCPAGTKMVGGNCVKDDQPEDCDPITQECDENGEPVCDPCSKLQQLVNNNLTMINNDNRIISLTETMTSNQNITNNNLNTVNNNLNTVNNNISTVNNSISNVNTSIQNVINAIEDNKPEFDTSNIEALLQQLIDKENTADTTDIDFAPLITKLDDLNQTIIDNKFDDTQLNDALDTIINEGIPVGMDLEPITDRQDEQTSLLEDIRRLLMPTNEGGDPSLEFPEVEESLFDPWGAIRGFDISNNMINASRQCPADKSFTVNLLVKSVTFSIPMTPVCTYLGYLSPIFLALAYFQGAMIILRSGD